jgi:hypothetical protein
MVGRLVYLLEMRLRGRKGWKKSLPRATSTASNPVMLALPTIIGLYLLQLSR